MTEAQLAVQAAAASIPSEITAQFESDQKLRDEDRETIIGIALQALKPFLTEEKPQAAKKA
jgi:hypothetical protein